jgi:hypothetical protein
MLIKLKVLGWDRYWSSGRHRFDGILSTLSLLVEVGSFMLATDSVSIGIARIFIALRICERVGWL